MHNARAAADTRAQWCQTAETDTVYTLIVFRYYGIRAHTHTHTFGHPFHTMYYTPARDNGRVCVSLVVVNGFAHVRVP